MDKPWRLHLANSAIQHLDIVGGEPALVAVWTRDGQVAYYDLENGAAHGTSTFAMPESPELWWPLLDTLKDPKERTLPYARIGGMSVWMLPGGKAMTYHGGTKIDVGDRSSKPPSTLTLDVTPTALAVDRDTQLVASLDSKGALLLGKPGGTVKTVKPGLTPSDEMPTSLATARGGKRIVATDGTHLVVLDAGKVSSKRELHYTCGLIALSPDGKRLLTFDSDSGVLRAYVPDGLRLTHQRFVVDVISSAEELQLMAFAELPPTSAAVSALAVDDLGRFAFAVFGQLCGASVAHLTPTDATVPVKAAPQPKQASAPKSTATGTDNEPVANDPKSTDSKNS